MSNIENKRSIISTLGKQCRVCGDKASAFNFDGLSCESCKAFFRRNAFRESDLKCHREGACEINTETRKICAACRLSRCFEIGMKKELILKRKQPKVTTEDQELKKIKCDVLSALYAPANPLVARLMNKASYPSLTSYEKKKIDEVTTYYKSFREENSFDIISAYELAKDDCMDFFEEYGKVVVQAVKNIPTVTSFCIEDQLIMVCNVMAVFADLRFAFYYDVATDKGMLQNFKEDNSCLHVSIDAWDEYFPEDLKLTWKKIVARNNHAMMNDPVIRDLLITLALFLEDDKISSPQALRNHYLEYYYLLRRYLQTKLKSREKFERQIKLFHNVLGGFPEINDLSKKFFLSLWPHYSSDLMSEIYFE